MNYGDILIFLVTNFFRTVINERLIGLFFDKDNSLRLLRIAASISFFILTSTGYLLFSRLEINILTNILGLLIMASIYPGNVKKKIVSVCLIYVLNMSCDVVVMISFPNYGVTPSVGQLQGSMTVLLIAACSTLIEKLVRRKKDSNYVSPHWKVLLMIPICSIFMIHYLMVTSLSYREVIVIEGIGLLIINIISLYLYSTMEEIYLENLEKEMEIQSSKAYAHQLDIVMHTQEQIRSLQHDMKYHIRELTSMAESRQMKEMVTYLTDMSKSIYNSDEFVYSGNKEIDGNLNYMLKRADEKLKEVYVNVKVPEGYLNASFDINIIISNLLENAIDGAEKSIEKMLSLDIKLVKGVLFITTFNSYEGMIEIKDNTILTQKENKETHGYGLKNIKRIVDKYHGIMDITYDNNVFCVDIMLFSLMDE